MNVEQFLYHEARLLDTQQYEAWLELFTDDATYWVPLEREQKDPFETSSIIHDDRTLLGLRVKQARHPDRKSTRLNSSHGCISYAVFCLKKKKKLRRLCWMAPASPRQPCLSTMC